MPGRRNEAERAVWPVIAIALVGFIVPTSASAQDGPSAGKSDTVLERSGRFASLEGTYRLLDPSDASLATKTIDLATQRGKTVLLDFWASWCRPCIEEIPETNAFAEEFGDRDEFVFLSINQDAVTSGGETEDVRDLVRRKGIAYLVVLDEQEPSLKRAFKIRAWPTRIMIAPNGEILEPPQGRLTLSMAAEYLRQE